MPLPENSIQPYFHHEAYAALWTAQLVLPQVSVWDFIRHVRLHARETQVPLLGYAHLDSGGDTMRFTMSRYPDFRPDRPPMPAVADCNEAAAALAQAMGGGISFDRPKQGLRAAVGLRIGGYDPSAPLQRPQDIAAWLPGCDLQPAHMIAARFCYDEAGRLVPEDYDEPVVLATGTQQAFGAIALAVQSGRQQHCPVEDFDRGIISMYQTHVAEQDYSGITPT